MNKLFVALAVAGLATILLFINAHARNDAFDSKGNLFVGDAYSGTIFKFTPNGKKSTFASDLSPGAAAFDSAGNLFVSDSRSNSILKFTPDRKKSTFASGISPLELAFDRSGNLFAADYYSHSIFKFAPDGTKSTLAADLTPDSVYNIAVDAADNLFVVDRGSKGIFKFTSDGTKTTFATGDFAGPTFDKSGNLYVWESGSILKFTPDGTRSTFAASDRISPDKKWEYQPDESQPKVTRAGTNEVALDLSDQTGGNGFGSATVVWAPDSKRFAFNYG